MEELLKNWAYEIAETGIPKGTLKFCGIKNIQWINITNIENMGDLKRKQWINKIKQFS